jgi:hypothetical protein
VKKLLLTFALAGVICAGASSSACPYWALAYNFVTGKTGWKANCNTLEEAKRQALAAWPGGRIECAGGITGFFALDYSRDGRGNIGICCKRASTLNEAYRSPTSGAWKTD